MRSDLLGVLGGGALLPLSRVLVVIQAMASFNLRSMRTLYDTLLVGLLAVLIASEGALSVAFLIFPLVFGVVALLFLVTAHLLRETQRSTWVRTPGPLSVAAASAALVVLSTLLLTSRLQIFFDPRCGKIQTLFSSEKSEIKKLQKLLCRLH